MHIPLLYLASASPRRSALLKQLHLPHHVHPVEVDETHLAGESPRAYVSRLACEKAQVLWKHLGGPANTVVLGADTTVAIGEQILGKPTDRDDGLRMLNLLSGRTHEVWTAIALCHAQGLDSRVSQSEVTFRALSDAECAAYWRSGEPADKAGGYAVQGLAAAFITRLSGSYSGVMGLPLAETAQLLALAGWPLEQLLAGEEA